MKQQVKFLVPLLGWLLVFGHFNIGLCDFFYCYTIFLLAGRLLWLEDYWIYLVGVLFLSLLVPYGVGMYTFLGVVLLALEIFIPKTRVYMFVIKGFIVAALYILLRLVLIALVNGFSVFPQDFSKIFVKILVYATEYILINLVLQFYDVAGRRDTRFKLTKR